MSDSSDSSSSESEDSIFYYFLHHEHSELLRDENSQDSHNNGGDTGHPDTVSIESLKDLAARETSKYWGCAELERTTFSLDDHLLGRICAKAFPVDQQKLKSHATLYSKYYHNLWDRAEILVKTGSVKECRQIGFLLVAKVARLERRPKRAQELASVSVKFEKQCITYVSCSKCMREFWCEHILAAILYRAGFPQKVPVHSPMTDTLSNLSRDQLIKLVQFTVNINPSHMILPLYQTIGELRDPESDTSRAQGAPDASFDGSNGDMGEGLWQMSLKKLKSNFKREIRESFDENIDDYFSKVIDLVHNHETYKAGEVLAVLATTLAGLEDERNYYYASQRSMLGELDILMASFILSFDGKGKKHLLDVLRGIHSSTTESSDYYKHWYANMCRDLKDILHSINIPSHRDTTKTTDVKAESEVNFLFPQSLRAEKFKTVSLHQLEQGNFTSEIREEPIAVMLFRFHGLEKLGSNSCVCTNYGTLLLRKCIEMKELIDSAVDSSRLFDNLGEDNEAGPSQPKVRRVDDTSQHRKAILTVNQHAGVIMHLLKYRDPAVYHSKDICLMVEVMLCLEIIERKMVVDHGKFIDCKFDERWNVFTSNIQESVQNKSFVELYSTIFLKHWNDYDTFYSDRNRSLLTLLTTTEDLPMSWRAQLCGNVVCSSLKRPSTRNMYPSDADVDVDVDEIVKMTALVAKVFITDGIADCCDTTTKILEACLVCSNEVTCQRVFGVFWEYRSVLNSAKRDEIMLRLLLRLSNFILCLSKEEIVDEMLKFADKIGLQFAVVSFQNWIVLSKMFDMHYLSIIFNRAILALNSPLSDGVIDALMSYLCAASHHDLECMEVLKIIPTGPKRKQAFESINENSDNFSCEALFHVARLAEENNSDIPLSDCCILSELGHKLLQKAFDRYCNPTNADVLQGRCLLTSDWVLDVLDWFFCRISAIGTEERATAHQFQTFMHSIGSIFIFDENTQRSFLLHMQNSSSLLSAIRKAVSERDIYINPHWYNWLNTR